MAVAGAGGAESVAAAADGGAGSGASHSQPAAVDEPEPQQPEYQLTLGGARALVLEHGAAAGHPSCRGLKRYLCLFLHRYLEFRLPEVEALAAAAGADLVWEKPYGGCLASPYWYAHLPSDAAAEQIASRALLVKAFIEVWGEGDTFEDMLAAVAAYPDKLKALYAAPDKSFKFEFSCFGFKWELREQLELIERFEGPTAFKGPIDLKTPMQRFHVLACQGDLDGLPPVPHRFYFGREVAASDRTVIARYALPSRRYLGPTSMDTEMAFLMCNQAQVKKGSLVLDPFVGTGSILLSAAHFGAHTLGTDIDMRVIKFGKRDDRGAQVNVWTNFSDAGLESPLGLLRCDLHRPPFRSGCCEWVDAVVCDPPYGVRAGGRKSTAREDFAIADRKTHISTTDPYTLGECLRDLMRLSARLLRVGGRLVYFLPAAYGYYSESELPTHPTMKLVANSEQILTTRYSRRLVTMEKVLCWDEATSEAHYNELGPPKMAIDDLHEHVYAPAQRDTSGAKITHDSLQPPAMRIPKYRSKCV